MKVVCVCGAWLQLSAVRACAVPQDAHCVDVRVPDYDDLSWFAVFDGHGGSLVAKTRYVPAWAWQALCCLLTRAAAFPLAARKTS